MGAVDVGTIESFGFGNDPIVIRKYIAGVKGGKVLDVSSFKGEYIRAGHVIIRDTKDDYRIIHVQKWIEDDESLNGITGY